MDKTKVDYTLYLVTDSTESILGDRDLIDVVTKAIQGGASVVQYRDKHSETRDAIRTAQLLKQVTRKAGVPLLINDRIDVALAVGADGVHIGQDDMDMSTARRLLGESAIIGVTASNVDEAKRAVEQGADYLGVGTVYATATKENVKSIIGPAGVRQILSALSEMQPQIPVVCIGGINASNVQRIQFQSHAANKRLDGVAVVSALIAAEHPEVAAKDLRRLLTEPAPFRPSTHQNTSEIHWSSDPSTLSHAISTAFATLANTKPLCHNMTNLVVQNFAANVALSIGGSPIMSSNGAEAADLAALNGSLVINMGTANAESMRNYKAALAAYNLAGRPVLFDPVGGGATQTRRDAVRELMLSGYFTCIKGNEAEISTVYGATGVTQHGVDSGASTSSPHDKARLVAALAQREKCVVCMTGATDFVSDGERTLSVSNGHAYLGEITGSGCSLGTTIAAFLACGSDALLATVAGLVVYEIAAERAAAREEVNGPGTFVPAFLDALYHLRQENAKSGIESGWLGGIKVSHVDVQ